MGLSLFDRIANQLGFIRETRGMVPLSSISEYDIPAYLHWKTSDYYKAFAGWAFACVTARSEDVSDMQLDLYRRMRNGESELITDHEALALLRSVNPWQDFEQLIEHTQAYLDLTGEAFWYLNRGGDGKSGKVNAMWLLRPDHIRLIADREKYVKYYEYEVPGVSREVIPVENMVHFKTFNPTDPFRGMSKIRAAALSIDTDDFAQRYNRKFFKNSAIPSMILETDQKLSDQIVERVRRQFAERHQGIQNAHVPAVLEGGLKASPFQIGQKDMEFLAGRGFSRDEIFAIFNVPKSRLGMVEDVNLNNAQATDVIYMRRIYKLMKKQAAVITEQLLPRLGMGDEYFVKPKNPVPDDEKGKAEVASKLFTTGAVTQNEIRAMFGLEEVAGLDRHYIPFSMVEVGKEAEDSAKELAARRRKGGLVKPPHQGLRGYVAKAITRKVMAKVSGEFYRMVTVGRVRTKRDDGTEVISRDADEQVGECRLDEKAQEALWRKTVKTADGYERRYVETARKFLRRQEKGLIERLEATEKALDPDIEDQIMFSVQEEAQVMLEMELPILRDLVAEMGEEAFRLLGLEGFDTATDAIEQVLSVDALKGTYSFNSTTARKIHDILTEAVQEGWGVPETVDRIREAYANISAGRAETLARTEIFRATGKATVEAYRQSGVVVAKQWFTAEDERVCPWCREMMDNSELRIRKIEESWFEEGSTFTVTDDDGKERTLKIDFENVKAPPLHGRCRCTLLPVTINTQE